MSDLNSVPFEGLIQHCSGCGMRHVSREFHTVNSENRAIFLDRFPKFAKSWASIKPSTIVYLCCQWFKRGHGNRLCNFAGWLVDTEPLHDTAPTSFKRKSLSPADATVVPDDEAKASKQRRVVSRPVAPRMFFEFDSIFYCLLAFYR